MLKFFVLVVMAELALFSAVAPGAVLQTDDFQSASTENWIGSFITPPTLEANGGPDGAGDAFLMISTSSPTGPGSNISVHNSSLPWTGEYASLDAGLVSVDLMNPVDSSLLEMRLVLFGPLSLSERWTSSLSAEVPNDGVWRNYEFSLAEEELTQVSGTSFYEDLMNNVIRIMLRHDAGDPSANSSPVSGSLGIDNVSLVANAQPFSADFDGDGDVDSDDLTDPVLGWQARFGNDLTGSNFLEWQRQFGSGVLPMAASTIVPEPSSLLLAALGLVTLSLRRKCA